MANGMGAGDMVSPGHRLIEPGSRVFVSHTSELAAFPRHRRSYVRAALDAVASAGLVGMDMRYLPATDTPPAQLVEAEVRRSSVYVCVVGFRYGSLVPGTAVSYTDLEFRTATKAKLPRLAFLLREPPDDESMVDPDRAAIDAFRRRLMDEEHITVGWFESADSLEFAIYRALRRLTEIGGRPTATPLFPAVGEYDPIRLGIHPAAVSGARPDPGDRMLTPYVRRDHDERLRSILRDGSSNRMVVLVGSSAAGKTRACYEAVLAELPDRPLLCPSTPEELLGVLDRPLPDGAVLWLNELQRYLVQPDGREIAVRLRSLLAEAADTHRAVTVIGSMWLSPYWVDLTTAPEEQQGGAPRQSTVSGSPEVRDLLTVWARRVDVADHFRELTAVQQAALDDAVATDARMAEAVAASGPEMGVTRVVAGGPMLVDRYRDLSVVSPVTHAVLSSAMDAFRIGAPAALPAEFFRDAVAGYLSPVQRAVSEGWLGEALSEAAREIRGVRSLTPVRTAPGLGPPDAYLLHDYLQQYGHRSRRHSTLPDSLWIAAIDHVDDVDARSRMRKASDVRARRFHELTLVRSLRAVRPTDGFLGRRLLELLYGHGDDEALAELRRLADAGDSAAACHLLAIQAERGDDQALETLRQSADDSARPAGELFDQAMWARGDERGRAELRRRVDGGQEATARFIEELKRTMGDRAARDRLQKPVNDGRHAARYLAEIMENQRDFDGLRTLPGSEVHEVLGRIIEDTGDERAWACLRERAELGRGLDRDELVKQLARVGGEAARRELVALADAGDFRAQLALAEALVAADAHDELRERAERGDLSASLGLLALRAIRGDDEALAELRARSPIPAPASGDWTDTLAGMLRSAMRHVVKSASNAGGAADIPDWQVRPWLIRALVMSGRPDSIAELRSRADAGDHSARDALLDFLFARGEDQDLAELRQLAMRDSGYAGNRFTQLLRVRGDDASIAELQQLADGGNGWAAERLAYVFADRDDVAGLRDELQAGNMSAMWNLLNVASGSAERDTRIPLEHHERFGLTPTGELDPLWGRAWRDGASTP